MRSVLLFTFAVLLTSKLQAQDGPPVAIFSFQDVSCGAWVKSGENESVRAQYDHWFRGFVSGYNFGNPQNQVSLERMPDSATLALHVDKYCRENPLKPFVSAAFDLVRELRDHADEKRKLRTHE